MSEMLRAQSPYQLIVNPRLDIGTCKLHAVVAVSIHNEYSCQIMAWRRHALPLHPSASSSTESVSVPLQAAKR